MLRRLGKDIRPINRLVVEMGICGNIKAQEALAELIAYLDSSKGFRKTRNLLGLFKLIRESKEDL